MSIIKKDPTSTAIADIIKSIKAWRNTQPVVPELSVALPEHKQFKVSIDCNTGDIQLIIYSNSKMGVNTMCITPHAADQLRNWLNTLAEGRECCDY